MGGHGDERHGRPEHAVTSQPPLPPPLHPPPAVAVGFVEASSGITASTFLYYVCIGFGCTLGVIAISVCVWLFTRRALRRRREREEAAAQARQLDPRRQQAEAVQRMIEAKRKSAAAARKPYLVVHPGGDAMVAFKDGHASRRSSDPNEELIKSYLGLGGSSSSRQQGAGSSSRDGRGRGGAIQIGARAGPTAGQGLPLPAADAAVPAGNSAAADEGAGQAVLPGPQQQQEQGSMSGAEAAQRLLSRRALVAAAALSGRSSSGISDVVLAEARQAAEQAEEGRAGSPTARQQQEQGGVDTPTALAAPLLPHAWSIGSSAGGSSVGAEDAWLLRQAGRSGSLPPPGDSNV